MTSGAKQQVGRSVPQVKSHWVDRLYRPRVLGLFLALATVVAYSPVIFNEFVNYDDPDYVSSNEHVLSGLKWRNVAWSFTSGHASNWHPLTWVSHMLDCQLFGQDATAHHLVNLGFHVANVLLLFFVMRRFTSGYWQSGLVAGLFALHPLHVESVAWISERKDVLSTLFFLLTLWAYRAYVLAKEGRVASHDAASLKLSSRLEADCFGDRSASNTARRRGGLPKAKSGQRKDAAVGSGVAKGSRSEAGPAEPRFTALWYFLALFFFALGLMSKPMLVTLPFLLMLLDYWPLGRCGFFEKLPERVFFNGAGAGPSPSLQTDRPQDPAELPSSWVWLILEKGPFLALAVASSVVTFWVQKQGGSVSTVLSMQGRVENALISYVRYVGKALWPIDLSVLYPHPGHWPTWQVVAAAALLMAASGMAVWLARKHPYCFTGWFWFLGTLIPVIGLVQVGIQSMADRYAYIPSIGLFIVCSWGLWEIALARGWPERSLVIASLVLLGACTLLTVRQVMFWRDSETLFTRAVQVTPRNYLAYNNLGFYLSGRGKLVEAMEDYRKSLEINPAYEDALNNMGYALAGLKRPAEAVPYYEAALRIRPSHAEVHNNLGNALSDLGKLDEAILHYRITLSERPDHADAHNNLGIALAMQGKLDEGIEHLRAAIRFKPNYASAHSNLGNALAVQRKLEEAIGEYEESLRLNPNDAQAHNNLANVLAEQSKFEQAIPHYDEALRLNPNNPEAHFNLGMVFVRQGKRDLAGEQFKQALRLQPGYPQAQHALESLASGSPPPR